MKAGSTIGVEEEYHLVAHETYALVNCAALSARAAHRPAGSHLHPEMLTSQLEAASAACGDLGTLREAVLAARREAATAAGCVGANIMATSTHPFASLSEIELMADPRYEALIERFGPVVGQLNLCGCHVHVSVPDLETAVAIMNHARAYLPVLAALTASSPFHDGVDTGYHSFRLSQLALWPQGGVPPEFESATEYLAVVGQLRQLGIVDDATMLLWELRPSARYPTLEFRIADVCTDLDDVVLYAGLVRSLVRTLGARIADGARAPRLPGPVITAARWRSARYGLADSLWSPAESVLVPADVAVGQLWTELQPDLSEHGELELLEPLLTRLLRTGTSAARQRRTYVATGSLREVARRAVALTTEQL